MFGKRSAAILICGVMAVLPALAGCAGSRTAQMEEYKAEGIAQMEAGEYAEAVTTFQTGLDLSFGTIGAEEIDLSYYKALALYMSGDADGAVEVYTALIDFGEDSWEAFYLRGNIYAEEGRWSEAVSDYEEAVARDPDDPELCLHICVSLYGGGLEDEAGPYVETALEFEPGTGEEYYEIGVICYMTGDDAGARTWLEEARAMGEDKALLMLGRMSVQEDDWEQAASMFESYAELHPDDAEALAQLGVYAFEQEEYEAAAEYFARARETADDELLGPVVNNLVAAYEYAGDFESAYEAAGEYLADHEDEELEREYEFLATRAGVLP